MLPVETDFYVTKDSSHSRLEPRCQRYCIGFSIWAHTAEVNIHQPLKETFGFV